MGRIIGNYKRVSRFENKPSGAFIVDGQEVAHTKQCGHCGRHVVSEVGSRIQRGFCLKCKKWLCGNPICVAKCVPFEKWLEKVEGKRHPDLQIFIAK